MNLLPKTLMSELELYRGVELELLLELILSLDMDLELEPELELVLRPRLNLTLIQVLENQVEYIWKIKKKARKEIIKKVRRKVMGRFEKRTILIEVVKEYQWEEAMRLSQLNLDV